MLEDSRSLAPGGRSTSLSPRELEVLERASEGYTNGEIAMQLNVTVHAVKWHLASIYRKLGVGNRTEAAITYVRELSGPGTSVAQGQG